MIFVAKIICWVCKQTIKHITRLYHIVLKMSNEYVLINPSFSFSLHLSLSLMPIDRWSDNFVLCFRRLYNNDKKISVAHLVGERYRSNLDDGMQFYLYRFNDPLDWMRTQMSVHEKLLDNFNFLKRYTWSKYSKNNQGKPPPMSIDMLHLWEYDIQLITGNEPDKSTKIIYTTKRKIDVQLDEYWHIKSNDNRIFACINYRKLINRL